MSFFLGCLLVVSFAIGLTRLFRLPVHWAGYVALGLLIAGVYLYSLLDAYSNPWLLWKRSWVGRYATQEDCLKEQWQKLQPELQLQTQATQTLANLAKQEVFGQRVLVVEGRTIFEFGPSRWSRMTKQKQATSRLANELLSPEIVSTVSFFSAPSMRYGFWPYYTPTYYASADDLRRLGEKTLAARAKQMLED